MRGLYQPRRIVREEGEDDARRDNKYRERQENKERAKRGGEDLSFEGCKEARIAGSRSDPKQE